MSDLDYYSFAEVKIMHSAFTTSPLDRRSMDIPATHLREIERQCTDPKTNVRPDLRNELFTRLVEKSSDGKARWAAQYMLVYHPEEELHKSGEDGPTDSALTSSTIASASLTPRKCPDTKTDPQVGSSKRASKQVQPRN
ncbi:uncharacterized protein RCC_07944 [Ramularia collo-cygni]|uniref:Uncharacterized protein n=1 Tax=Ramularia collo-cygni TaxID=112498 RepID=A0A2D3VE20_9PEZI|nr:uncharacterized protein RCC_07944 [Ramularia collo-cygni]CZT22076.1 uncharacterized protein RCC_07944 [Ramularia collo-cygni]